MAILVTPERMAANVNVFDEKTRNSKNGCSMCNCRQAKKAINKTPTTKKLMTSTLPQPLSPTLEKPYNNVPKPMVERMAEKYQFSDETAR